MSAQFIEGLEGRQFFSVTPAGAGPNPDATRIAIQQRDRDRVNDNCQAPTAPVSAAADLTRDQAQLRLRDGSCKL